MVRLPAFLWRKKKELLPKLTAISQFYRKLTVISKTGCPKKKKSHFLSRFIRTAKFLGNKSDQWSYQKPIHTMEQHNPLMPVGNYSYQFFICCPRDAVSRHNEGTSGAPLKPLRVDSALRALSTLRGLRRAPAVPPLCRETQSLGQQMLERWEQMG